MIEPLWKNNFIESFVKNSRILFNIQVECIFMWGVCGGGGGTVNKGTWVVQ